MDDWLPPLLTSYRRDGDLLALLSAAQKEAGGLTPDLLSRLARELPADVSTLYGVVSFYSFLSRGLVGRHVVRVCQCVPCRMAGAEALAVAVERELGIRPGETTADGRFSLQLTNCIGACDQAPAMMIDEHRFGDGTEQVAGILGRFV